MTTSEAAHEIVDIFKDIFANDLRYCTLCLRTELERRLVKSSSFAKSLRILRLRMPARSAVCHVCDAALSRAVDMMQAVNFAVTLNHWYKNILNTKDIQDMPSLLERHMEASNLPGAVLCASLGVAWRATRRRTHLAQTDILLVDDGPVPVVNQVEVVSTEPESALSSELVNDADSQLRPCEPDNVVVIDDDDPPELEAPLTVSPVEVAPVPLSPNPESEDPPELVPLESLLDNKGTAALIPNTMEMLIRDKGRFVLHPLVRGSDGAVYAPSIGCGVRGGRLVRAPPPPLTPLAPAAVNVCGKRIRTQGNNQRITGLIDVDIRRNDECNPGRVFEPTGAPLRARVSPEPPAQPARPVQSARIDWEDKIPMDVISFMDATDPFADQILNNNTSTQYTVPSPYPRPPPVPTRPAPDPPEPACPPLQFRSIAPRPKCKRSRSDRRDGNYTDTGLVVDLC